LCQYQINVSSIKLATVQVNIFCIQQYDAEHCIGSGMHTYNVQQALYIMGWPMTCEQSKQILHKCFANPASFIVQSDYAERLVDLQVVSTPVSREAVLTWLEGVTTASLEDIVEGLMAKQQMPALSDILQELQSDFEIATKAGRYFML